MIRLVAAVTILACGAAAAGAQEIKRLPEVSLLSAGAQAPLPVLPQAGETGAQGCSTGLSASTGGGCASSTAPMQTAKTQNKQSLVSLEVGSGKMDVEHKEEGKLDAGMVMGPPVVVLPEATTTVHLSSSDLNRIVCSDGEIKEALTSDEKGLMTKITGKDAFLKFKVAKRGDGKLSYSTTPTELYVVCGNATYSMIAFPGRRPSQTIKLSSGTEGRIKTNQAHYAGLPFEKRVMRAIKEVYTDSIPESYLVTYPNRLDQSWQGLNVLLHREVSIEGEGLSVKEYRLTLKKGAGSLRLTENLFLKKEFVQNPVAVSMDKHVLRPHEEVRLFVVEQRPDTPLGGAGLVLPEIDGAPAATQPTQRPSISGNAAMMGKAANKKPNAQMPTIPGGGL